MNSVAGLGGLAFGLLLFPAGLRADTLQDGVPLQIISSISESNSLAPPDQPTDIVKFVLENQSDKTITAWRFSCVEVESDDQVSIGSVQTDAFLGYERQRGRGMASDPDGAIEPGGLREEIDSRDPSVVKECGIVAVIFADTSYAGNAGEVQGIFAERARMLSDVQIAIDIVSRGLKVLTKLHPDAVAQNSYADTIYNGLDPNVVDDPSQVEQVLDYLRSEEALIQKHLPDDWRPAKSSAYSAED